MDLSCAIAGSCGGRGEADKAGYLFDAVGLHAAGVRMLLARTARPQGRDRPTSAPSHHLEAAAPLDRQTGATTPLQHDLHIHFVPKAETFRDLLAL